MATKKKEAADKPAKAAKPVEFEPSDFGVGPDDPTYQKPAFASEKEMAVLSQGPDARREALNADIEAMHKA